MRTSVARGFRLGVVAVMALMLAFAGMVTAGAGAALADVPPGGVTHVFMNIDSAGSTSQRTQYGQLIDSLRNAAGHPFRDGVMRTQTNNTGLIRLTLTLDGQTATLWITPQNLYVRGYSTNSGATFVFSDTPTEVRNRIRMAANHTPTPLSFESTYNQLSQAASRGRENMPISFADLRGSALNLARQDDPFRDNQRDVARSLMFMIQFTSEAARFSDVFSTMGSVMDTPRNRLNGLPTILQELENDWRPISRYALNVTRNPATPPANIGGLVGTLHSFRDAALRLRLVLSTANNKAPGGPNREEL